MSRQAVEQVLCDRCKRIELQASSGVTKIEPDFKARFKGEDLIYSDLCSHCLSTLQRLWKDMTEWDRELVQKLVGPSIPNGQAAPVQSAPDYSPPKPHSAAGGAKK